MREVRLIMNSEGVSLQWWNSVWPLRWVTFWFKPLKLTLHWSNRRELNVRLRPRRRRK